MAETTILLTRHGQSEWNAEGKWQGQADPPLSEIGRNQAMQGARKLGTVDVIVSSPQIRAVETAVIISEHLGVGPVQIVEDLRERDVGPWSGLTTQEIRDQYPGYLEDGRRPEGFEPDDAFLKRCLTAIDAVSENHEGAMVLAVCHGGVIGGLERHFGLEEGRVPNLSGRVITNRNGSWTPLEASTLLEAELSTGGDTRRL